MWIPPFRADIVGKLSAPRRDKNRTSTSRFGEITHADLAHIENVAIEGLVAQQTRCALKAVTDGEFCKSSASLDEMPEDVVVIGQLSNILQRYDVTPDRYTLATLRAKLDEAMADAKILRSRTVRSAIVSRTSPGCCPNSRNSLEARHAYSGSSEHADRLTKRRSDFNAARQAERDRRRPTSQLCTTGHQAGQLGESDDSLAHELEQTLGAQSPIVQEIEREAEELADQQDDGLAEHTHRG